MRLAGEGHLSALLLCSAEAADFFSSSQQRGSLGLSALLLLGARGRGIEAPVRAVAHGPLAQAEKPRQVTAN